MALSTDDKPSFHRQTRLGLVVYGGVSLSIYMNGVCREFYNAVRGRGIYKIIKALTDSDIVVDIISGTSAGGINGVLLAFALANSTKEKPFEFEDFADIWRDSGDIKALLRKPSANAASSDEINSFLDGESYYQEKLTKAFETVHNNALARSPSHGDWYSAFDELDLFVTGTDFIGKVNRFFDNTGKIIDTKDHRTVFVLKHRNGRKNPFSLIPNRDPSRKLDQRATNPLPAKALAKLCRITSCFPVAFPVVTICTNSPIESEDNLLVEWGDLSRRLKLPGSADELYFVDGGVLDNRPFTYTIDAIYHRHYWRPVKRYLFYIDPSPEEYVKRSKPNIWQIAADSLVSMPRYESIAGDLQHIARHNENARRYKLLRSSIKRKQRQNESSESPDPTYYHYHRCRLIQLRNHFFDLLLNQDHHDESQEYLKALEEIARIVGAKLQEDDEIKRDLTLDGFAKQFDDKNIDIDFSIRQHFFILEEISGLIDKLLCSQSVDSNIKLKIDSLEKLAKLISKQLSLLEIVKYIFDKSVQNRDLQKLFVELNRKLLMQEEVLNASRELRYLFIISISRFLLIPSYYYKLLESVDQDLEAVDQEYSLTAKQLPISDVCDEIRMKLEDLVKRLNRYLMNPNGLGQISQIKDLVDEAIQVNSAKEYSILQIIDNNSIKILGECGKEIANLSGWSDVNEDLLNTFQEFRFIDQEIYPLQYLSDFQSDDIINVVRVSPVDANKGFGKDKHINERLAGAQFRGFGGFFKRSWRSNDILWGRLDGLNRIVDALITEETIKNFSAFRHGNSNSIDWKRLFENILNEPFYPDSNPAAKDESERYFKEFMDFFANDHCTFDGDLHKFQEWLVKFGQSLIIQTDLEDVFKDGVKQQNDWNQYKQPDKYFLKQHEQTASKNKGIPQFLPAQGGLDRGLSLMAVERLVNESMDQLKKEPQGLQEFFRTKYRVGSERIENDLPPMIQRQLIASFGLVLRDIFRTGPTKEYAKKSVLFNLFDRALQSYELIAKYSGNSLNSRILVKVIPVVIALSVFLVVIHPFLNSLNEILRSFLFVLLASGLVSSILGWKALRFGSLLLVFILILNLLFGLPVQIASSVKLKTYLSDLCPFIPTKLTLSGCKPRVFNPSR